MYLYVYTKYKIMSITKGLYDIVYDIQSWRHIYIYIYIVQGMTGKQ